MKTAIALGCSLLCCLLAGCASSERMHSAAGQADMRQATVLSVERKIASIVRQTGDWEMSQYRSYNRSDIDGDEVSDTALLTTFERGNIWRRDLLVCLSTAPARVMLMHLGAKGKRMAETFEVEGQHIVVKGKEYAENDALCCPSLPYRAVYLVSEGKVKETK
jgi:hypothetical protein